MIVFTVHGAPGNRINDRRRRRAPSTRWVGADVRWRVRRSMISNLIATPGLGAGDSLDKSDLFPVVWRQPASA